MYNSTLGNTRYRFENLKDLMAKATPLRSGDSLAGIAAIDETQRAAAMIALADVPLKTFLNEQIIPYEDDEVTRLIIDSHNEKAFEEISHLTVGDFRNWLLNNEVTDETIKRVRDGFTPEMVAAVSKIMRNQDLILTSSKCEVITKFRSSIGRKGTLTTRLQPNHHTDCKKGIIASVIDGLMYGNGDACIGINPATDNLNSVISLLNTLDEIIEKYKIPTQSCILTHITTTIEAVEKGAPVDLVFQSIGGTEKVNSSFGVNLKILKEGYEAGLSTGRCSKENNFMYFETGQGSALSAGGHHNADQQTIEARSYAVAKKFSPLLVNTVVGFIGPEYLFDGKQIIRAGLEDHFCGKLLGIPMGVDICYTNHAEADQDDMDILLTLLGAAGCNFIMGVPGSDDIMLNYQSTSFHDALYIRQLLNLKPSEEFERWLIEMNIFDGKKVPSLTESRLKLPEIL